MKDSYHALRMAFLCGQEGVPWHLVLHAIREGLDLEDKYYILKEKDYKEFPQLREFMDYLK